MGIPLVLRLVARSVTPRRSSVDRKLGAAGQKLGACSALCHIRCLREGSRASLEGAAGGGGGEQRMNHYELRVSNVGDVEMVLCRRGEALCLTRKFTTNDDADECHRVYESDGIITEVVTSADVGSVCPMLTSHSARMLHVLVHVRVSESDTTRHVTPTRRCAYAWTRVHGSTCTVTWVHMYTISQFEQCSLCAAVAGRCV